MSGWISKASNVFKREVPDAPQPFTLVCGCGEEYHGVREERFQRIDCTSCGYSLFILPRDVYPAPHPLKKKKAADSEPVEIAELAEDDDELRVIEETPARTVARSSPSRRKKSKRSKSSTNTKNSEKLPTLSDIRQRMRDAAKPRPATPDTAASAEEPSVLSRWIAELVLILGEVWRSFLAFWSPFRLVAAGVLLVMVFTAGWMIRQSLLARAVNIAKQESELGLNAIDDQKWVLAREHLAKAVSALDQLGRTDPESQTVRQYLRETNAQFRLCSVTIEELLSQAETELAGRKGKEKSTRGLAIAYNGDWLVLEGMVENVAEEESRQNQFVIQLPVGLRDKSQPVTIQVDWPLFEGLVPRGKEKHFILAGAIEDCRRNDADDGWVIELNATTGFLWTHLNTYHAVGFEFNPLRSEEVVQKELNAQAKLMEVPE